MRGAGDTFVNICEGMRRGRGRDGALECFRGGEIFSMTFFPKKRANQLMGSEMSLEHRLESLENRTNEHYNIHLFYHIFIIERNE